MQPDEIRSLYDAAYAQGYDDRFLLPEWSRGDVEHEEKILADLLQDNRRWLDVACGTGYFLSRFPGVSRAGLDLSPEMLSLAKQRSPDALFFQEGDFRDEFPEWKDGWDLVSCMSFAYCYVETIDEFDAVIGNLASWTKADGCCFLPVTDMEDITRGKQLPYLDQEEMLGGRLWLNAVVWSWKDEHSGRWHRNLVSPHLEHMLMVFRRHFSDVEVIRYPVSSRKAILARSKR